MINDKASGKFVFSLKLANSPEARELMRLSLLHHAANATGGLKVWIAGKTAARLVRSMFEVHHPKSGDLHDRLRALAPKKTSSLLDVKSLGILKSILVFFGVHASSPLHGNPLLPYIMDLMLAVALCNVPCGGTIDEELKKMAIKAEEQAELVEKYVASKGLQVAQVKQYKSSIRHYDLADLKRSHVFVCAVVDSLVKFSLMKTVVSVDKMGILLAAARHSVSRDDTVVLLNLDQLNAAFSVLQKGGARHIFGSMSALGDLLCFDVGGAPNMVMEVCNWIVVEKARLELISSSAFWGNGLYRLLLLARRHGGLVLPELTSLAMSIASSRYGSLQSFLPLWNMLLENLLDHEITVNGVTRAIAFKSATVRALDMIKPLAEFAVKYKGGDSFYGLLRFTFERCLDSVGVEEAARKALKGMKPFAKSAIKYAAGESFYALARGVLEHKLDMMDIEDAIHQALVWMDELGVLVVGGGTSATTAFFRFVRSILEKRPPEVSVAEVVAQTLCSVREVAGVAHVSGPLAGFDVASCADFYDMTRHIVNLFPGDNLLIGDAISFSIDTARQIDGMVRVLRWEIHDPETQGRGNELCARKFEALARALRSKTRFTIKETRELDITDVRPDSVILSNGVYFRPASMGTGTTHSAENNAMFRTMCALVRHATSHYTKSGDTNALDDKDISDPIIKLALRLNEAAEQGGMNERECASLLLQSRFVDAGIRSGLYLFAQVEEMVRELSDVGYIAADLWVVTYSSIRKSKAGDSVDEVVQRVHDDLHHLCDKLTRAIVTQEEDPAQKRKRPWTDRHFHDMFVRYKRRKQSTEESAPTPG